MAPNTEFTRSQALSNDATFDPAALTGKSVVLTGGASGIGEQCVRDFAAAGAFVTFGDLTVEKGEQMVAELGADKVAFVSCDVTKWTDQLKLFKTALERSPSKTIDIVFANAGIARVNDEVYTQEETSDGEPIEPNLQTLQVNLIGVMYTVKLALFYFPKQPQSHDRDRCILLTGSMSSYLDHSRGPQYNSSKLGVRGIMKSIRQTGPRENIRINMIAPWFIDTGIAPKEVWDTIKKSGSVQFAQVEDAGRAIIHLASDNSINGRSITVVPRSYHKRGYYDLQQDDWNKGEGLTEWMHPISQRHSKASTM